MKNRLVIALLIIFLVQIVLIFFLFRPAATETVSQRTPIPTLPRATLPAPSTGNPVSSTGECRITALSLIGSWVQAGKPESETFLFESMNGDECQGTFEQDVHPLFTQSNIWYPGAVSCTTCHSEPLERADARLDLSTYESIMAGSRRESSTQSGQDILGDEASWKQSRMYVQIFTKQMPPGRPAASPPEGPTLWAGEIIGEND
jgi:hypothetical protein